MEQNETKIKPSQQPEVESTLSMAFLTGQSEEVSLKQNY